MDKFLKEAISPQPLERYETALGTLKETIEKSSKADVRDSRFNNVPIKFWTLLLKIDCLAGVLFLREFLNQLLVKQVLDVLIARDALQKQLEKIETPAEILVKVSELDRDLREQFEGFSRNISQEEQRKILTELEDLRDVCEPPQKAWWWFPKIHLRWWERFDLAWDTLAVLWLVATLSLLTDISSRFLSGGPDLFGSFAVIFQSILALASGGTLTKTGQTIVETTFKRWKIPRYLWEEAKFVAASLLLLIFVGLRLSLPGIALVYSNAGFRDYQTGRLTNAQSNYKRALALNPNDGTTHFYLGSLYEDLQDLDSARTEYQIAIESGHAAAYNNMARLYILDKNYSAAASLLRRLQLRPIHDETLNYCLHKNLGWARLKQDRLAIAKAELDHAIEIAKKAALPVELRAPVHCLLAQVLEKREGVSQQALMEWDNCNNYATGLTPEEDEWIGMARERLRLKKIP